MAIEILKNMLITTGNHQEISDQMRERIRQSPPDRNRLRVSARNLRGSFIIAIDIHGLKEMELPSTRDDIVIRVTKFILVTIGPFATTVINATARDMCVRN